MSARDLAATAPIRFLIRVAAGRVEGKYLDAAEDALAALERQAADAQAEAERNYLDYGTRIQASESARVRAEEALRQARPLVVEIRDNQRWTPMSGARRDWAVEMLVEIDAALAAAGADTP